MSRFHEATLHRRTDEPLRPAEKDLRGRFHSTENIRLVYSKAKSDVNPGVSYFDVTTTMDTVFRSAIRTENLPRVSEMNSLVLRKLSDATDRTARSQKQYSERIYHNSNVPTHFLPRPSFDLNTNDKDDTMELLRR